MDDRDQQIGNRIGDISDLPEALRNILSFGKLDELEMQITTILKDLYGGTASLDELLVGLYRRYGVIPEDRRTLANKLYRMIRAGLIESVPKRKGIYRIK
jgi:hypothetical protein